MVKDALKKMLQDNGTLNLEHLLRFRFFEKHKDNQLIVSAVEVEHMGKRLRLFNSYFELQNIFGLEKKNVYLRLDAVSQLHNFFEEQGYQKIRKHHDNWAEYSLTFTKLINPTNLVDEIYTCFNYYYQLCIDNNIPINDFDY